MMRDDTASASASVSASASAVASIEVRVAEPVEYGALGEIVVAAYRGLVSDADAAASTAGYEDRLRAVAQRAVDGVVLAAVRSDGSHNQVLGCITYVPGPESPLAEDVREGEAGVRMLGVHPAAQRQGIGEALMVACIERARAAARERLVLHSTPWMASAHRLYERLGFRRAPERDWTPVPAVPLWGFVLDLERP